jgi:catechol 2,3-dioxygenase-like lactoylglutathione lyase family enzyme
MNVDRLDHLVLTVQSIEATCDFYTRVLGMQAQSFGANRTALLFGSQKINLHALGHEFEPKAANPVPGSADLCFITPTPISQVMKHLDACGIPIVEGPVQRSGALGEMLSVYIRDPDANLIEIATYAQGMG